MRHPALMRRLKKLLPKTELADSLIIPKTRASQGRGFFFYPMPARNSMTKAVQPPISCPTNISPSCFK